ncbi:hypothetical protein CDD83_4635 [Cordyceps sp. RAO-2017]|nr:hypothetical protein CDD83_4635 [Cordyceps sp. RAO-2017]
MVLDTGYIDSLDHLGINSKERILFRHVLRCAPLETAGRSQTVGSRRKSYTRYYYGPMVNYGGYPSVRVNYTLQVNSLFDQYIHLHEPHEGDAELYFEQAAGFRLRHNECGVRNRTVFLPACSFAPVPQLFRPDADTVITFLSGEGVSFSQPSPDPWYLGVVEGPEFTTPDNRSYTLYWPQEAASPMACFKQFQYCNGPGNCGPLASSYDAYRGAAPLFNVSAERLMQNEETATVRDRYIWFSDLLVDGLESFQDAISTESLQSQPRIHDGTVDPIPNNQWQLDVIQWWDTMLATIQQQFISLQGLDFIDPDSEQLRDKETINWHDICANQKILSSDHTSFSLLGLLLTYIIGALIVVMSYALEPIYGFLWRRWGYKEYTFLQWTADETLQLQRAAHQGIGSGTWTGFVDAIPTTEENEALADLAKIYIPRRDGKIGEADSGNQKGRHDESTSQSSLLPVRDPDAVQREYAFSGHPDAPER